MIMRVRDESGNFIEIPLGAVSDEQIAEAIAAYLTENPIEETDPTVPDWAKRPTKPTYKADEVGTYSKLEINTLHTNLEVRIGMAEQAIDTKASIDQLNTGLIQKADKSTTYTKTEVDNLINLAIGQALEGDY